jgi:riboflavin kinase/FMN adenylyltransferase
LLGYDFFFSGAVVEGNKLGRTIGYPTANLQVEDTEKLIPGDGVYAVEIGEVDSRFNEDGINTASPFDNLHRLKGMMNIGVRPTVDGSRRVIEVNIFDFDSDLYGKTLRIFIKKHLRGEQKFTGLDALKQQLSRDKENAIAVLG